MTEPRSPGTRAAARAALRAALATLCAVAPWIFVLSLPVVDLGVYRQTETVAAAMHGICGIAALLLGTLACLGDRGARRGALQPVPLVWGALALWSAACAAWVPDPGMSLHGTLEHGVGALWHLDVAVLAASYHTLGGRRLRRVFAASAIGALLAVLALNALFFGVDGGWTPHDFREWVPLLGLPTAVAAWCAWRGRVGTTAAGLLLAASVAQSDSRSAVGLLILAAIAAAAAAAGPLKGWPERLGRARGAALLGLAAVLIPVALAAAGPALEAAAAARTERDPAIPSAALVDHAEVQERWYGSLWSRSMMLRLMAEELREDPVRLLRGEGWGRFRETVRERFREVPGRVQEVMPATAPKTFWDAHAKAAFHSHNLFAEALHSAGLAGMALLVAGTVLPLALARRRACRPALLLAGGLVALGSLWFLVPSTGPVLAFAMASAAGRRRVRPGAARIAGPALLAVGLPVILFGSIALSAARLERGERAFPPADQEEAGRCAILAAPLYPTGDAEGGLTMMLGMRVLGAADPAGERATLAWTAANHLCAVDARGATSLSSIEAGLRARALLASVPGPIPPPLAGPLTAGWMVAIESLLARAPHRTEVAIPFVESLLARGEIEPARNFARAVVARMEAADPVRAWILGRIALAEQSPEALPLLAKALRGGIAGFVPVQPEIAGAILAAAEALRHD